MKSEFLYQLRDIVCKRMIISPGFSVWLLLLYLFFLQIPSSLDGNCPVKHLGQLALAIQLVVGCSDATNTFEGDTGS